MMALLMEFCPVLNCRPKKSALFQTNCWLLTDGLRGDGGLLGSLKEFCGLSLQDPEVPFPPFGCAPKFRLLFGVLIIVGSPPLQ